MSDLLGAWSLDDRPARRKISPLAEARMLARLPGHPDGLAEIAEGPLWLVGARAKLVRAGAGCLGHEGVLVGDGARRALAWDAPPEGHFALARADLGARRLTLLRGLSGGERLYYARLPGLVLFAASLRPLLAHPEIGRALNRDAVVRSPSTAHPKRQRTKAPSRRRFRHTENPSWRQRKFIANGRRRTPHVGLLLFARLRYLALAKAATSRGSPKPLGSEFSSTLANATPSKGAVMWGIC